MNRSPAGPAADAQPSDAAPPPATADVPSQSLAARLRRIAGYFGTDRKWWVFAVLATLTGSLTEAGIPALLKPLLDRGFTQGSLQLWAVPAAVLTLFVVRGVAGFAAQYALSRIANDGMVKLRAKLALVNDVAEANMVRPVDDREGDMLIRIESPDHLKHQKFVEIGIEKAAHDGIEPPTVIVGA